MTTTTTSSGTPPGETQGSNNLNPILIKFFIPGAPGVAVVLVFFRVRTTCDLFVGNKILEACPGRGIFKTIDFQPYPRWQSFGPEDFTWACFPVAPGVIFVKDEIDYSRSLLLDEAVRAIEFPSKSHSHSDMRWKHTMDPSSFVNVGNIQQSGIRVCADCLTLVSCLQKHQWNL